MRLFYLEFYNEVDATDADFHILANNVDEAERLARKEFVVEHNWTFTGSEFWRTDRKHACVVVQHSGGLAHGGRR